MEEQYNTIGTGSFFDRIFKAIKKQDALEFVGEAYMIHQVIYILNLNIFITLIYSFISIFRLCEEKTLNLINI